MMMRRRIGFTLIELLVVIAIISLLVSILLPSLQSARELAIEVKCVTQLHSLVTAVHIYGNDYDQTLFWRLPDINTEGMEMFTWVGREGREAGQTENSYTVQGDDMFNKTIPRPLNAYVGDPVGIAHDPGDTSSYVVSQFPYGAENWFEMTGNSYTFNCYGHPSYPWQPDGPLAGGLRGKSMDNIERPSQTVFALDSSLFRFPDDYSSWHRDGMANMAFIDGHAELRTLPLENPYYGGDNEGIYWDETKY